MKLFGKGLKFESVVVMVFVCASFSITSMFFFFFVPDLVMIKKILSCEDV